MPKLDRALFLDKNKLSGTPGRSPNKCIPTRGIDLQDWGQRICRSQKGNDKNDIIKLFLDLNREYQAVAVDYFKVNDKEQILEKVDCYKNQIACGILFRKECLIDIGLYDKKFKMREGHDLRRRFEKKFKIARLNVPLYKYRTHSGNRTNKKKVLKKFDKMLKDK